MEPPVGNEQDNGGQRMPSVRVRIEVPRGSFVKRGEGGVEFVSPVPCPFNYGSVIGTVGEDGDALDAIVLGGRLRGGEVVEVPTQGVVRFEDDGKADDKLICGDVAPSQGAVAALDAFFRVYAPVRRLLNRARGRRGRTRYGGVEIGTQ